MRCLFLLYFTVIGFVISQEKPVIDKIGKNVIVSNYKLCSKIAKKVIKRGGNGIDAAISTMLCEGLGKPQDMGLGGGFFGIIKFPNKNKTILINSREIGPKHINSNSFDFKTSNKIFGKVVGAPSALKGYLHLHKLYGKLQWSKIVNPIEKLARKGFPCVIGDVLKKFQYMYIEEKYRNIFINNKTGLVYQNGEIWKRPDLADTLKDISKYGDIFYDPKIKYMNHLIKEINSNGGILIDRDFLEIRPLISKPLTTYFKFHGTKFKLETTDFPGGGISVAFILGIMESFYQWIDDKIIPNNQKSKVDFIMIEAFKFAFAMRTSFGDDRYNDMNKLKSLSLNKEFQNRILRTILASNTTYGSSYYNQKFKFHPDSGTANIIVKTTDEIIAITSSINLRFGSWIISDTGIVFNNQISDFSLPKRIDAGHLPPSRYNFPEPGKYPISSMSPSIISVYDKKNNKYVPKYALGGAGGPKIITAVVHVINKVINNYNIVNAVRAERYHHQLEPNVLELESDKFKYLHKFNHVLDIHKYGDYSAVTGIEFNGNNISATFDPRRPGSVSVF